MFSGSRRSRVDVRCVVGISRGSLPGTATGAWISGLPDERSLPAWELLMRREHLGSGVGTEESRSSDALGGTEGVGCERAVAGVWGEFLTSDNRRGFRGGGRAFGAGGEGHGPGGFGCAARLAELGMTNEAHSRGGAAGASAASGSIRIVCEGTVPDLRREKAEHP